MKNFLYILPALLIIIITGCAATPPTPSTPSTPAPDGLQEAGSFVVREDQVMRLAAGTAGKGTLIFQGWQYSFTFTDAKVKITGASNAEIVGTVYNLEKIEDFQGHYVPTADIGEDGGLRGFWGKNDKGVTIHVRVETESVLLDPTAKGATVTLIK